MYSRLQGLGKMKKTFKNWILTYIEYFFFSHQHWGSMKYYSLWLQIFYVCTHTHVRRDDMQWTYQYFTLSPRSYKGHLKIVLQHFKHWLLFMDSETWLDLTCQKLTKTNWYAQKTISLLLSDLASSWSCKTKASRLFVFIINLRKLRFF